MTSCATTGPDAAELRVAEGIARAGVGEELAVGIAHALGHHDGAVAVLVHALLDPREEPFLVEGDLREQDDVRGVAGLLGGEAAGRRDPARVPAHHLEHEHLGRGARHRGDVEAGFADRHGDVLGDRAEARAAVGDRQVVVHGLRHVDAP